MKKPRPDATRKPPVSKDRIVFGRVVAEREYQLGDRRVLVQLGTPHRASGKADWYCPFRIVSGRERTNHRVFGQDALQALMLAFDVIRANVEALSPEICWDGSETPGDVGIYRRLTAGQGFDAHTAQARELERGTRSLGGLRLPVSERAKHQGMFAAENIVCEELPGRMLCARFPPGTRIWSCPQIELPSGTKMVVALGVGDGPGGEGRRIVLVPSETRPRKSARTAKGG